MAYKQKEVVDVIKTEVIFNSIMGIAKEIGSTLIRTSYSPNIKQRSDCSTAILNVDGEVIAQAPRIPIHLGSMMGTVKSLLEAHPIEELHAGDMFISNDPYAGEGQHLPDLNVVAPVFYNGQCQGFVANIAHHSDIGGMLPGSEAIVCENIYQEGLRIPPIHIVQEGRINQDIINLILLNSRTPNERRGDLLAQISANQVGIRRMQEVYGRFGLDTVNKAVQNYLLATEKRFRNELSSIEDGEYYAEDYLDPESFGGDPIKIGLSLIKQGDQLILDFSETAQQLTNSRNVPPGALYSTVYCVIKSLIDPGLPANSGYFRAINIKAPKGSLLNPEEGAAVGARSLTCAVVGDVIVRALSKALPNKALAGSGPHHQVTFFGQSDERGMWVDYETFAGGSGARAYKDGMDAVRIHASGASNLPIEALENVYPLLVRRYALRNHSGGHGTYSGGLGVIRDYEILENNTTVSMSSERQTISPKGLNGGEDGLTGEFILNPGTLHAQKLPSATGEYRLKKGDVLSIRTPGGAGYGSLIDSKKLNNR